MLFSGVLILALAVGLLVTAVTGSFLSLQWLWVLPVSFLGTALLLWLLLFLLVVVLSWCVDPKKPQQEDSKFHRRLLTAIAQAAKPVLRVELHTDGLETMLKKGRFLMVCNHLGYMDPVILLGSFPDSQLAFITKRENDRLFLVGKLMHKILCQPINRENDREALKTILNCIDILKEDKASIAVFPEGYTSLDGKLHPFRSGVFKIAQKAQVPIVVCTLRNTQYVFRNAARLKKTHVHLHLVGILYPEAQKGLTAVDIGNLVHHMMATDLGPENVLQTGEES